MRDARIITAVPDPTVASGESRRRGNSVAAIQRITDNRVGKGKVIMEPLCPRTGMEEGIESYPPDRLN